MNPALRYKICTCLGLLYLLVLFQAAVGAYPVNAAFPNPDSPLGKKEHPRLLFTAKDIPTIRNRVQGYYKNEFQDFVNAMDSVYNDNPSSKADYLLYFDARNYAFLCAIDPTAMNVQHLHSKQEYCDKAVAHALAISDVCDDQEHDFNNWWREGGCKMSASLVYDWTYNSATGAQRQQMADKIVRLYENKRGAEGFPPYDQNRHIISNQILPHIHGTLFGSLAVWGDPYVTQAKQDEMLNHMNEVFLKRVVSISDSLYGPDTDGRYTDIFGSGNPEGPDYGFDIVTAYMYPIAAASTALGENYFETSPFTKYFPLSHYYKLRPFPVNGNFYYAWHDTGGPDAASYPTGCSDNACQAQRPRVLRFWAYRVKDTDPKLAGLLSWMAGTSDFRVPPEKYTYALGTRQYGLFDMFLGGERDVPPLAPDQANMPLFKRMGDWTVFKSSHDLYDSTYLEIDSPIWYYVGGHNKFVPAGLQLSKFGTLIVKSVNSKGDTFCVRAGDGDAPVYGSITGPLTDNDMSLGFLGAKTSQQSDSSLITEGSASDIGDVIALDSVKDVFDVFGYDYSRMYLRGFLASNALQYMIYLRGAQNNEFFVEYNHIVSSFENLKVIHTPSDIGAPGGSWSAAGSGSWTSTAKTYSVTNSYAGSHGTVFMTSVLPNAATFRKIGGSGYEWVKADGTPITGTALNDQCRNLAGYYTLQIKSKEPNFITVYQPGDSNTLKSASKVQPISSASMTGVQIQNRIVMFSLTPDKPLDSAGYSVSAASPSYNILAGLRPVSLYNVDINGNTQQLSSTKGGVLHFQDSGTGNRAVSISLASGQQKVSGPMISPNGGNFQNSVEVSLSTATSGAVVYYTKDGSAPTQSSILCGNSCKLTLTDTTIVKARAFKSGMVNSDESSATFTKAVIAGCPWDLTGPAGLPDGKVSLADVLHVLSDFGKSPSDQGYDPKKNFNTDPKIDLGDILAVLSHFGDCPLV